MKSQVPTGGAELQRVTKKLKEMMSIGDRNKGLSSDSVNQSNLKANVKMLTEEIQGKDYFKARNRILRMVRTWVEKPDKNTGFTAELLEMRSKLAFQTRDYSETICDLENANLLLSKISDSQSPPPIDNLLAIGIVKCFVNPNDAATFVEKELLPLYLRLDLMDRIRVEVLNTNAGILKGINSAKMHLSDANIQLKDSPLKDLRDAFFGFDTHRLVHTSDERLFGILANNYAIMLHYYRLYAEPQGSDRMTRDQLRSLVKQPQAIPDFMDAMAKSVADMDVARLLLHSALSLSRFEYNFQDFHRLEEVEAEITAEDTELLKANFAHESYLKPLLNLAELLIANSEPAAKVVGLQFVRILEQLSTRLDYGGCKPRLANLRAAFCIDCGDFRQSLALTAAAQQLRTTNLYDYTAEANLVMADLAQARLRQPLTSDLKSPHLKSLLRIGSVAQELSQLMFPELEDDVFVR